MPPIPTHFSPELADLIEKLLLKEPTQRLGDGEGGAQDVKQHPFFSVSSFFISVIIQ